MLSVKNTFFTLRLRLKSEALLLQARSRGTPLAMHHGLQRSGTNYLLLSLLRHGVPVLNYSDPARHDPRHKHCRWQHNKTTLIQPIADQYGNSLLVSNIDELNSICGLHQATRHIVVFKERIDWLQSICNWGLRCGWFANASTALAALTKLAQDYSAYHAFWSAMKDKAPGQVEILQFEKIRCSGTALSTPLTRLGLPNKPALDSLRISEVPRSPGNRTRAVTKEDVLTHMRDDRVQSISHEDCYV